MIGDSSSELDDSIVDPNFTGGDDNENIEIVLNVRVGTFLMYYSIINMPILCYQTG